jgi:hypothetical protein
VIEPTLRGAPEPLPDLTLAELVPVYLERHCVTVRPRTIQTLRERLVYATRAFGNVRLAELERISGELASWSARLPERSRYASPLGAQHCPVDRKRWVPRGRGPLCRKVGAPRLLRQRTSPQRALPATTRQPGSCSGKGRVRRGAAGRRPEGVEARR